MPSESTVALLAYCLSSIAMTVMNKAVLSSASKNPENAFKMNFMLLLCQSIACVLLLRVCKGFKLLQYRDLNQRDSLAWLPVSLMLVAMIYTGSKSLQFLTVSMFTIFKNLTIMLIALGEQNLFKARITPLMWLAFFFILLSSLIGSANDLAFSLPGYLWMGTNCFTSAGYILYMRQCVKRVGFADFDSVYFNNTLSIPILILLSLILDDWKRFLFDYSSAGANRDLRWYLILGILASSISSFTISYTTAWCARVASSTTYSVVGALNKLPIAISGLLFFKAERRTANSGNFASILVAFLGGVIYSIAQIREKRRKVYLEMTNKSPPLVDDEDVNLIPLKDRPN